MLKDMCGGVKRVLYDSGMNIIVHGGELLSSVMDTSAHVCWRSALLAYARGASIGWYVRC